jgi:excisionase family DNA binding protein
VSAPGWRTGGRLLTAAELAGRLGVSKRWIYGQVEKNDLPAYRFGRALAFELEAVESWLRERRVGRWEYCAKTHDLVEFGVVENRG